MIVENLSNRCGWYPLEAGKPAKVTWAVISAPDHGDGMLPGAQDPGRLPDAGLVADARPVPVLPARRRRTPLTTGMRVPRSVDPRILARVKAALERL
jgi:hypothetical protein